MFNNIVFFENHAVNEIMWKNILEPGRQQVTLHCWITKATNTHTECAILIAFPLKQRLQERSSVLRHS
jgi:hypothetical protein